MRPTRFDYAKQAAGVLAFLATLWWLGQHITYTF